MTDQPLRIPRRELTLTVTRITAVWVVLFSCYFLIPFNGIRPGWPVFRITAALVIFLAAAYLEISKTARSDTPQLRAAAAVGTLVPLLLVVFSSIYLSISVSTVGSFNEPLDHVSALYFTVTILGTVGFGDIAAKTNLARLAVSVQILLDFIAFGMIVRLLSQAVKIGMRKEVTEG